MNMKSEDINKMHKDAIFKKAEEVSAEVLKIINKANLTDKFNNNLNNIQEDAYDKIMLRKEVSQIIMQSTICDYLVNLMMQNPPHNIVQQAFDIVKDEYIYCLDQCLKLSKENYKSKKRH